MMEQRKLIKLKGEIREMSCSEVYEQFKKFIHSTAYKYNDSTESLEDLIQVANVGLVQAFNTYEIESGNHFMTYLWSVVAHSMLKHLRNVKRKDKAKIDNYIIYDDNGHTTTNLDLLTEPTNCEDVAITNIVSMDMKKFINELKPRNKKIIELSYFNNMTQRQIGEKLNITQATVSKIIKKSLKILKTKYECEVI